jgi:hypothetical protein
MPFGNFVGEIPLSGHPVPQLRFFADKPRFRVLRCSNQGWGAIVAFPYFRRLMDVFFKF